MPFDGHLLQPALLGRAPTGGPVLNRLHPLAHKLRKAFVFNAAHTAVDLLSHDRRFIDNNQNGGGGLIEAEGMYLKATNGGTDDTFELSDAGEWDWVDDSPCTYSIGFTTKNFTSTSSSGNGYLGGRYDAVTSTARVRAVYYATDGLYYLEAGFTQPSGWGSLTDTNGSGYTVAVDEPVNITVVGVDGGSPEVRAYKNQEPAEDGSGAGLNAALDCDSAMSIGTGNTAHTTHYKADAWYRYFYAWVGRALTAAEARAVNANPYAPFGIPLILDSAVPFLPMAAGAGGGGPTQTRNYFDRMMAA